MVESSMMASGLSVVGVVRCVGEDLPCADGSLHRRVLVKCSRVDHVMSPTSSWCLSVLPCHVTLP
jgi:hypothetical protein